MNKEIYVRFRNRLGAAALGCAMLSCAAPSLAQSSTGSRQGGSIDGKLTDWHSVPLAQAEVVVKNLSTGETAHTTTSKNGSYKIPSLGPGEYRLEAVVPALGKGQVEGILVSAGHATRVQAALVMESPLAREPIQIQLHDLDPVSPAVTTMIPTEELSSLPVRERDWHSMEAATPAANPVSDSAGSSREGLSLENLAQEGEQSLSIGGDGSSPSIQSVDGVPHIQGFRSIGKHRGDLSLGESAISSMQARTGNEGAGAPRGTGGAMNLESARGGNQFHGQIFYRNRVNAWGAQNPFTQIIEETSPATAINIAQFTPEAYTPPRAEQTLGLGVGRAIRRDKLYWFAAIDGLYKNDPALATVRHPLDFFAQPSNDQLEVLAARLDLSNTLNHSLELASYSSVLEQLNGLLGRVPRTTSQVQGFGRVDWKISERDHLTLDANAAIFNSPGGAIGRTSATYGSHSFGNSQSNGAWGLARWERFLTANLLNDADFQYGEQVVSDKPQTPSSFESTLLANDWGQLPEIITDSRNGFVLGKPARLVGSKNPLETSQLLQDEVRWVHGQHLVTAGASFDHIADSTNALINQTGTYSFADVLNFASDTASFAKFGLGGINDPLQSAHNCDATGQVHRAGDVLLGLGFLPCYSSYSQRVGPADWHLSTNDFAAFLNEQWQPFHHLTLSAGLRAESEQLPPPIAAVENPLLPQTQKLPSAGVNWGPRFGLAWSPWNKTVLRMGAGLYFGRIDDSLVLAALTQTGSSNSDLNLFFKPTDQGAPPFPYVFSTRPQQAVVPGAVSFAPNFHQQQVDQAVAGIEQELPSHWLISVSGMASLGRRLPISVDTNLALSPIPDLQTITYAVVDKLAAGPIKTPTITVPFYLSSPSNLLSSRPDQSFQQLDSIESKANSTYQAAMVKLVRYGGHGLSLRLHYLYAHATDWNPNETGNVAVNNVLDPANFRLEYGTSNLDIRHSGGFTVLYETPWKLRNWPGWLVNSWSISALGQYRGGLPYTMRTSGYIPGYYSSKDALFEGVGPGMNGSGGDNRVYGIGRNTYRYPGTYSADSRIGKRFNLSNHRQLELLAESFNLFNHQNVTAIETTGYYIDRGSSAGSFPTLNFLTGLKTNTVEFGKPLDINATSYYHPREIQLGVRARF